MLPFPKHRTLVETTRDRPCDTDLLLWLRADQQVTSASNLVSAWGDARGGPVRGTQGTGINQPLRVNAVIDGHPVIRFDGTNDDLAGYDLSALVGSDYTVMAVASRSASAGGFMLGTATGTVSQNLHLGWGSGGLLIRAGHFFDDVDAVTPPMLTGQFVCVMTTLRQGYGRLIESMGWLLQRTSRSTPLAAGHTDCHVGSASLPAATFFTGDLAELLVYNRSLGYHERRALEAYVAQRYPSVMAVPVSGW